MLGTLPKWRSVVSDDDQLRLSLSESLQGLPVTQLVLAGLHDEGKPRVDGFRCLLDLLLSHHFVGIGKRFEFFEKLEKIAFVHAGSRGEKDS